MAGMVKLIYSTMFDTNFDVSMRIVEDSRLFVKSASTIFGVDYSDLKPDKNHVGLHVVALGAFERYGPNRNGDSFPKVACEKYHSTFVKYGAVFRHHQNKDRNNNLGEIKMSAFNPVMDRIELFIHVNKDRARDELEKLAKEGDIPFSMACKVEYDRCSRCNTLRRNMSDPNQCDHVRYELGKMAEDGTITCTHNDEPKFFDISFVTRPADRIAWHLKVAGDLSSVKLAEDVHLWVPDSLAIDSPDSLTKLAHLKRLVEFYDLYLGRLNKSATDNKNLYFSELIKAADIQVSDDLISDLRLLPVKSALYAMAKFGMVLNVEQFFKYALGDNYKEVVDLIPKVKQAVPFILKRAVENGECQNICNDSYFDIDFDNVYIPAPVYNKLFKFASFYSVLPEHTSARVIEATLNNDEKKINIDSDHEKCLNNPQIKALVEKYAAFKISVISSLFKLNNTDKDSVLAVGAAQDIIQ